MANNFDTLLTAAPGSVVTLEPDYIVVNDGVSYLAAVEAKSVANPDKVLVLTIMFPPVTPRVPACAA